VSRWIEMFRHAVAPRPALKGVWRRRDGGWLVRGRVTDPTGKQRALVRVVWSETATEARVELERLLDRVRRGLDEESTLAPQAPCPKPVEPSRTPFAAYAASLFERKVREGRIRSEKGVEKWKGILTKVLVPAFGEIPCAELRRAHIHAWRDGVAERVAAGELSPNTANTWLAMLRTIVGAFVAEHELERNPALHVPDFDLTGWQTYTDEEPNSLTPDEVPRFLAKARQICPQHYAFIVLMFSTGLRPSTLRPLRRHGPQADMLWNSNELLVRRSHTRKQVVMSGTKTGLRQRIPLPSELVEVLRWHVDQLGSQGDENDLLFPSETGGFRSASTLDKPFAKIAKAAGIKKHITPRAGRRTFQDLARAAEVKDIVARAVSGHQTEDMQRHYSTVSAGEVTAGLARVIELAKVRESLAAGSGEGAVQGGPRVVRKRSRK
jgi:integrase